MKSWRYCKLHSDCNYVSEYPTYQYVQRRGQAGKLALYSSDPPDGHRPWRLRLLRWGVRKFQATCHTITIITIIITTIIIIIVF